MVSRAILINLLCLTLLICADSRAAAQDSNAVGGTVWDRGSKKPLDGVTVTIPQVAKATDDSQRDDGVYVLKVPTGTRKFDVLFEKSGYAGMSMSDIENNKAQRKLPIVRMVPQSTIKDLPPAEARILADQYLALLKHASQERKEVRQNIEAFARRNIWLLYNTLGDMNQESRTLKQTLKQHLSSG